MANNKIGMTNTETSKLQKPQPSLGSFLLDVGSLLANPFGVGRRRAVALPSRVERWTFKISK